MLLSLLAAGDLGIRMKPESLPAFELLPDHARSLATEQQLEAEFVDETFGVQWWLYYFPGIHLDLGVSRRDHLVASLEWPARNMFEQMAQHFGVPARTADDPTWSPMIDVEFLAIGEAASLRTVHRMIYTPGREFIMGHILVPLAGGLFEARAAANNGDAPTGTRESVLMLADDQDELASTSRQAYFDDPKHDPKFPDHPLTRVRAALRWMVEQTDLDHHRSGLDHRRGPVELGTVGCRLVPPPRFIVEPGTNTFSRVSFCGTDGLQALVVDRIGKTRDLEQAGRKHATKVHRDSEVDELELDSQVESLEDGREVVIVTARGSGHAGRLENTFAFIKTGKIAWSIGLTATLGIPTTVVRAELLDAARSLQDTRPARGVAIFSRS